MLARTARWRWASLMLAVALGCQADPTSVNPARILAGQEPTKDLNGSLFNESCYSNSVTLVADADGATSVMWTNVSKKVTATSAPTDTFVAWRTVLLDPIDGARLQLWGNFTDSPHYRSAWLSANAWDDGELVRYDVRHRNSAGQLQCISINGVVRSSNAQSWQYGAGITSYKLAVGETLTLDAVARNAAGEIVPNYANDYVGVPIPSQNLTASSSNTSIVTVGNTTLVNWFVGRATFTGVAPGSARARWTVRGRSDSSFVVDVCTPGPNVATSIVISPSGPLSLSVLQQMSTSVTVRNCTGRTIGGSVSMTSDNPYVASVEFGVVRALHGGTANIVASRDGVADTLVVNVPEPQISLELVGPAFVPRYSFCAWQVFVYGPPPQATLNYQWEKAGEPIGYNAPSVTNVPTGFEGFEIRVTVSNPDGYYPTESASMVIEMDDRPNSMCAEDEPRIVLVHKERVSGQSAIKVGGP